MAIMSKIVRHCTRHLLGKCKEGKNNIHFQQIAWDIMEETDMYKSHYNPVMVRGHVTIKKEKLIRGLVTIKEKLILI